MDLLKTLLSSALTSGVVVWLSRTWISERLSQSIRHEYDLKMEAFRGGLKSESDASLEKLKAQLQLAAAQRNIVFSRIHEKQLEIISELAGKLDAFQRAVGAYVSHLEWAEGPSKEERRKIAAVAFDEFVKFYRPRRLFFPTETIKKIETFQDGLFNTSLDFMLFVEQSDEKFSEKKLDAWKKANDYATKEIPKLMEELENDFRTILGIQTKGL